MHRELTGRQVESDKARMEGWTGEARDRERERERYIYIYML